MAPAAEYTEVMKLLLLLSCILGKAHVDQIIEDGRSCSSSEDCVFVNGSCDFGCWVPVNEDRADEVQQAIDDYLAAKGDICNLQCSTEPEADCISGQCVAIHHVD